MSSTAVVILNWNGKDFMKKFIPQILSRTYFSGGSALYVADNGSQDGSVEWLRETWPDGEVRLICFDRNYGFTGGYNRAFAEIERSGAKFDYYLLLNSDIEVTDGWLGELERFMDSHPRCGACAPKTRIHAAEHVRPRFSAMTAGRCSNMPEPAADMWTDGISLTAGAVFCPR